MNELLISIGVSKYESKMIPEIPGAKQDAARIRSLFSLWGVEEENIYSFIDESAQKASVLKALRNVSLAKDCEPDTIFIYFAGHGTVDSDDPSNIENVLYCYDTEITDVVGTGLTVSEIIKSIERCKPKKLFLFIDACYVQIDHLPHYFLNDTQCEWENRCFFALISTWGTKTHEEIRGGIFTSLLLRGFAELRNIEVKSCSDLATYVESQSEFHSFPKPKSYLIGTANTWILDGLKRNYNCKINGQSYVKRTDSLIALSDEILKVDTSKVFCFYGKAKAGKTILALEMEQSFSNHIYYSVNGMEFDRFRSQLASTIYQKVKSNDQSNALSNPDLSTVIEYISRYNMFIVIILDHFEQLSTDKIDILLDELLCDNTLIVSFSRKPLSSSKHNIVNILVPELTMKEFHEFQQLYSNGNQRNYLYDHYKDEPQRLKQELLGISHDDIYKDCIEEITHVCLCGGFIDVELFAKCFSLSQKRLFRLVNAGLIQQNNSFYLPHDSLFEYSNVSKDACLKEISSMKYWKEQLYQAPNNTFVKDKMAVLIISNGFKWLKNDAERILDLITEFCIENYMWIELKELFPHLIQSKSKKSVLSASAAFAHVANDYALNYEKDVEGLLSAEEKAIWDIYKCEVFYWKGKFNDCIKLSCRIRMVITSTENMAYCYLNEAVGHFFLGNWSDAKNALNKMQTNDNRLNGWRQLIMGTILAIRGEDFEEGIKLLKSSVSSLNNDTIGLGIAYCNLGECYYKNNDLESAQYYLENGERYAILSQDIATLLEIQRNKLLVYLATNHCFDAGAYSLYSNILNSLEKCDDETELMQVFNTLAIASAYNNDSKTMIKYLQKAEKLTKDNGEYELYTLMNRILLHYIEGNKTELEDTVKQFMGLAHIGQNRFAIKQLQSFWSDISDIYNLGNPPVL